MKVIALALVLILAVNAIDYDQMTLERFNVESIEEFKGKYLGLEITDLTTDFPEANNDHLLQYTSIPTEFDARKQWPGCIGAIRNQANCGSCWAFSGSETLADRFCIASSGKVKQVLSPQYMVSCDYAEHACQGGMLNTAWQFLERIGTVTESCMPYQSGQSGYVPSCLGVKCTDGRSYIRQYKAASGSTRVFRSPQQIKLEIMTNGPVQTGFIVYSDFPHYDPKKNDGVYVQTSSQQMGGHAVKIIGWGHSQVAGDYWLVANSWDTTWGIDGLFKIKLGECQIDSQPIAGHADVSNYYQFLAK